MPVRVSAATATIQALLVSLIGGGAGDYRR